MKKKIVIILSIIISVVLLIPIPTYLKDGGTVEYNAILYGVTKRHSLWLRNEIQGYLVGTEIRILMFEVYSNVEFVEIQ